MKLLSLAAGMAAFGWGVAALAQPVEVVLRLLERVPMETLARSVVDPASPRFRGFYTAEEIRVLAGPADAEYYLLGL